MKLVGRLFAQAFWNHFAVVLIGFAGLQLIFRFLDESKLISPDYTLYDTIYVAFSALPFRLYQDLPFIVLIAVSTSMGELARTSQITVLRSAGLSRFGLFGVLAAVLAPLYLVSLAAAEYGIMRAEDFSRSYKENRRGGSSDTLWSYDDAYIVFASLDRDGQIREWRELETPAKDWYLASHLTADTVEFVGDESLQLSGATRTTFFDDEIRHQELPSYARSTKLAPDQIATLIRAPELLRLSELVAMIRFSENYALNNAMFERMLIQRLSLPITLIALAFLGFQTAFGSWRSGSTVQSVIIAIGFGIVYKYVAELAGPLAILLGIPVVVGTVTPLMIVVVLARLAGR